MEKSLAVIGAELEEMSSLCKRIQRCSGGSDAPRYVSLWTTITDLIFPPEDIEQLYHRQERGFTIVCTELRKIRAGIESERKRWEDLYEDVLEQKCESEERLLAIQDEFDRERERYSKRAGGPQEDPDRSRRRIKYLTYQAEHQQTTLDRIEKRRTYLHDVCEHGIDIIQTYDRLYHQATGFLQEARIFREAHGSFSMNSELAESLFGALDTLIENVAQLRQGYHDSRQKSEDYARELLQETESAEQFQELDEEGHQ